MNDFAGALTRRPSSDLWMLVGKSMLQGATCQAPHLRWCLLAAPVNKTSSLVWRYRCEHRGVSRFISRMMLAGAPDPPIGLDGVQGLLDAR
jgi:hypothetical protein